MRRRLVTLGIALGMILPGLAPAAEPTPSTTLQALVDAVRDTGVPGVVAEVRIGSRQQRVRSGVADLRTGRPMPYGGHLRIASTTKTFVAVAVLQLVEEGRLRLDDTVERWLPGIVHGNGNDGGRITVRDLLQHTSGLVDYGADLPIRSGADFERERFRSYPATELVALSIRHPPLWTPEPDETRFAYGNVNFVLAGMIVEAVTGREWEGVVRDRIARPLGLRQTFGPGDWPFLPSPHARTYFRFPGEPMLDTTVANLSVVGAAGAMVSSVDDVHTFLRALVRGKLVGPSALASMRRTVPVDAWMRELYPGSEYGLGLLWRPLSCGGGYWGHVGEGIAGATRSGVTADGLRSIVVHQTTEHAVPEARLRQERATTRLLDAALCAPSDLTNHRPAT